MKYLYFLVAVLVFAQCEPSKEETLPPITTTGQNTMGCLVNGEVFVANHHGPFDVAIIAEYIEHSPYLIGESVHISGSGLDEIIGLQFIGEGLEINTAYVLNDTMFNYGNYYSRVTQQSYTTNILYVGELTLLRLDTINRIISGIYWFNAINSAGEVAEIRDGRFDAIY